MTYVFDHIFKTGGTTFHSSYLPAGFPPSARLVLSGRGEENARDLERAVALGKERRRRLLVVAGHNAFRLRPHLPGARYLTLVRDPVERAISGYLHARFHPGANEMVRRTIEEQEIGAREFVEKDLYGTLWRETLSLCDYQARFLLGCPPHEIDLDDRERVAARILGRFHAVGRTEEFERFLFWLHRHEAFPLVLFNRRLVRDERRGFALEPGDREAIAAVNAADERVVEWVREAAEQAWRGLGGDAERDFEAYRAALARFQRETGGDENAHALLAPLGRPRGTIEGLVRPERMEWLDARAAKPRPLPGALARLAGAFHRLRGPRPTTRAAQPDADGRLRFWTASHRWRPALAFPLERDGRDRHVDTLPDEEFAVVEVRALVHEGRLECGLEDAAGALLASDQRVAGDELQRLFLYVDRGAAVQRLVLRNGSPDGRPAHVTLVGVSALRVGGLGAAA